ncbi:hypothetical protein Dtox_2532 [Desulfofarcimen acetoxidans DSM 771]|uniref:Uncharacterized protein n=1 Tax=Desulfofarcimen acetoxidans (strain ATCC 49208 / DSM 771 / KCTC 5769 / VKM B-1644 / 5575) TaxID=485916 RepID=C8W0S9_DESAS|nr:hypothetical protein Dtox_2532 [Desulfofarcimen acetoxidans DSM 771]
MPICGSMIIKNCSTSEEKLSSIELLKKQLPSCYEYENLVNGKE